MDRVRTYLGRNWRWVLWGMFPVVSLVMHAHLLDLPLQGIHAWRQCETASNVALFADGDANILNPHVYSLEWVQGLKRMEFPLMQWLMSLFFRVFGEHVLILRLLSWVIGFATVLGFFRLLDLLFQDKAIALAGAWCWMFSPLIFYYSINPLPDNFALMAGVWGLAFFMRWYRGHGGLQLIAGYGFLSLAVATKLPFIVLFAVPFGWVLRNLVRGRGKAFLLEMKTIVLGLVLLAPALAWYAWVIPQWTGNGVIEGILDSSVEDIPELWGIFWGNLVSTLPELLLNYAALPFFLWGIWQVFRRKLYKHALALPFGLMALGCIAYFIFEINMITTIHDYYLFPFLPGLFILVAIGLQGTWKLQQKWARVAVMVLLMVLPLTAGLRAYNRWHAKGVVPVGLLENVEALRAAVPADARIIFGNDVSPHISLYHLRHFGWTVHEGNVDVEKFKVWLELDAEYLYSNSRNLEANAVIAPYLGELVGEWGEVKVWRLL